ncbi:MAG: Cytidylate kinase [Planctomycetes bacterium]|nr:Cytidylate kinase [Planctomycetota bacterium]
MIAIDGPAGAGKSTCARLLAARLGYRFLDTGALYRAVTCRALWNGLDPSDEEAMAALAERVEITLVAGPPMRVVLDGEDVTAPIRGPAVSNAVSTVAALPRVRTAMVRQQRAFAAAALRDGTGVVAEGRDIGTVVFPDADVKFFLDADPRVRAERRAKERGDGDVASVQREIEARDKMDTERDVAPLRAADDAVRIDSTGKSEADVLAELERAVAARAKRRGGN